MSTSVIGVDHQCTVCNGDVEMMSETNASTCQLMPTGISLFMTRTVCVAFPSSIQLWSH